MCGCWCLSARSRSYVTETVAQTKLGTFKLSPFTCLPVSNLQQMRTESAHCLQFIFRSCHLFVESSGCVWGDWKRRPFICTASCRREFESQYWLALFLCLRWQCHPRLYASGLTVSGIQISILPLPPPNLLTTTAPRHPFHTNLTRVTCIFIHQSM